MPPSCVWPLLIFLEDFPSATHKAAGSPLCGSHAPKACPTEGLGVGVSPPSLEGAQPRNCSHCTPCIRCVSGRSALLQAGSAQHLWTECLLSLPGLCKLQAARGTQTETPLFGGMYDLVEGPGLSFICMLYCSNACIVADFFLPISDFSFEDTSGRTWLWVCGS